MELFYSSLRLKGTLCNVLSNLWLQIASSKVYFKYGLASPEVCTSSTQVRSLRTWYWVLLFLHLADALKASSVAVNSGATKEQNVWSDIWSSLCSDYEFIRISHTHTHTHTHTHSVEKLSCRWFSFSSQEWGRVPEWTAASSNITFSFVSPSRHWWTLLCKCWGGGGGGGGGGGSW